MRSLIVICVRLLIADFVAEGHPVGGITVTDAFSAYLERLFPTGARFPELNKSIVSEGTKDFEMNGKRNFSSRDDRINVRVGVASLNDSRSGITAGRLEIPGYVSDSIVGPSSFPFISISIQARRGAILRSRCKKNRGFHS